MTEHQGQRASAALWVTLILALALRCAWIALIGGQPAFDAQTYYEIAARLAQQHAYVHGGQPTAFWPVGYPALLSALFAIFGSQVASAWALNVVAGLVSSWCLHAITLRLGFSRRAAGMCALLAALNPVAITYSCLVVTETVFVALVLLATVLAACAQCSRGRLLGSGALLGCAALVRPVALVLPLWLGLCGVEARPSWRAGMWRSVWLVVGLAIVVVPWGVRNAVQLGVFAPVSTNGGMNLYIGNHPHASGRYEFEGEMARPFERFLRDGYLGGAREVEFDRRTRAAALAHITQHPGQVVVSWPRKLMFTYFPDLTGLTWNRPPDSAFARAALPLVPLTIVLHELILLVLAGIGLGRARRAIGEPSESQRSGAFLALPLAAIALFSAFSLLYFGMPRFHFPTFPWLELYAGVALAGRARARAAGEPG